MSCPRAMEDVPVTPVSPVSPVNPVSAPRETRCKFFMKQMAGDVFGEAFLDLYWPVNLLHWAIYVCFVVSLSYSFLWFSRFAQAQCGRYRIFGGSTANCTFEVVGFLVYVWMTCLSVKLGHQSFAVSPSCQLSNPCLRVLFFLIFGKIWETPSKI